MRLTTQVAVQSVPCENKAQERQALKMLRNSVKAKFEKIVKRDEQLIRYTSQFPAVAQLELLVDLVREQYGDDEVADGRFTVVAHTDNDDLYAFYFLDWVNVRQKHIVNVESIQPKGQLFIAPGTEVGSHQEQARFISLPSDVDESYALVSLAKEARARQKVFGAVALAVLLVVGSIYSMTDLSEKEAIVVRQEKTVFVDTFEEYKQELAFGQSPESVVVSLVLAHYILDSIPPGWIYGSVQYSNQEIVSDVRYSGGSNAQLKRYILSKEKPIGLTVEGQRAYYQQTLAVNDHLVNEWGEKTVRLSELRDLMLEVFAGFGAKVMSNAPVPLGGAQSQRMKVTFENIDPATLVSIGSMISGFPISVSHGSIKGQQDNLVTANLEIILYGVK